MIWSSKHNLSLSSQEKSRNISLKFLKNTDFVIIDDGFLVLCPKVNFQFYLTI